MFHSLPLPPFAHKNPLFTSISPLHIKTALFNFHFLFFIHGILDFYLCGSAWLRPCGMAAPNGNQNHMLEWRRKHRRPNRMCVWLLHKSVIRCHASSVHPGGTYLRCGGMSDAKTSDLVFVDGSWRRGTMNAWNRYGHGHGHIIILSENGSLASSCVPFLKM